MDDTRLLKQLLYGELTEGQRSAEGQLKRYKDNTKKNSQSLSYGAQEPGGPGSQQTEVARAY